MVCMNHCELWTCKPTLGGPERMWENYFKNFNNLLQSLLTIFIMDWLFEAIKLLIYALIKQVKFVN